MTLISLGLLAFAISAFAVAPVGYPGVPINPANNQAATNGANTQSVQVKKVQTANAANSQSTGVATAQVTVNDQSMVNAANTQTTGVETKSNVSVNSANTQPTGGVAAQVTTGANNQPAGAAGLKPAPSDAQMLMTFDSPQAITQDSFLYFPDYKFYYNSRTSQYIYLSSGRWIYDAMPPPLVSVKDIPKARSMKMRFHDNPERHYDVDAMEYPPTQ